MPRWGLCPFKYGFGTDRGIVNGQLGRFLKTLGAILGQFWVPKIGPKALRIAFEGADPQSLIGNTAYCVLEDLGSHGPPQISANGPKIDTWTIARVIKSKLLALTLQKWFRRWSGDRRRNVLGQFWYHFGIILCKESAPKQTQDHTKNLTNKSICLNDVCPKLAHVIRINRFQSLLAIQAESK